MGCSYFYDGSIKDRETQQEAINFVRSYFDHIDHVLLVNHIEGAYVQIVNEYRRRYGLFGYPIDYPFNFYGIIPFYDETWHEADVHAQFIFNRSNNGRLVTLDRIPEHLGLVAYNTDSDFIRAPEADEPMIMRSGGIHRTGSGDIGFPLMLCAFKFRYCRDLEVGDDYDTYDYALDLIDDLNLHAAIYDKSLDYNALIKLYTDARKKYPKKRSNL